MTMPNFLIIGAAKAGTTALYHYLRQHPEIYLTPVKETNFFALEGKTIDFQGPGDKEAFSKAVTSISQYEALFLNSLDKRARGEASPIYLYSSRAPQTIRRYIPKIRLIAVLRNPVERAFSSYLMQVRDKRESATTFKQALAEEDQRIQQKWEFIWHYTKVGFYGEQLDRYYKLFPTDNIRVFLYEELQHSQSKVMAQLFDFLGVDNKFMPNTAERHNTAPRLPKHEGWHKFLVNRNPLKELVKPLMPAGMRTKIKGRLLDQNLAKPELDPQLRRELIKLYRDDILKLQDLIHRDLSAWLK